MHTGTSTRISKAFFEELVSQTKEGALPVEIEGKFFNDAKYSAFEDDGQLIIRLGYTCREFTEDTPIGKFKIPKSSQILSTVHYIFSPQGELENTIDFLILIQPNLQLPIRVGGSSDVYSLDQLELSDEASDGPSVKGLLDSIGRSKK